MTDVTYLYRWVAHVATEDDEWAARCGETDPQMLVETGKRLLPTMKLCPRCKVLTNACKAIR